MNSKFENSYARALGGDRYNDAFISRFYEVFMASSEAVARSFQHTDMSVQKTMLHDSLQVVLDYHRTGKVSQQLQRLAQVHSRAGQDIVAALYDNWLDSLVMTVSEFDPEYDQTVERAWREAFVPGIQYMITCYDMAEAGTQA